MSDYVTVPVSAKFGGEPIGEMRILKSALPPHPDFCFALAFRLLEATDYQVTKYELLEIAPVDDSNYANYVAHHLQARSIASSSLV